MRENVRELTGPGQGLQGEPLANPALLRAPSKRHLLCFAAMLSSASCISSSLRARVGSFMTFVPPKRSEHSISTNRQLLNVTTMNNGVG